MGMTTLVWVNLRRNWLRTTLTLLSVTVAVFLFCALGGVVDTLRTAIQVGSETRLVTRNAISLVFPLPLAYRTRIAAVPGVARVGLDNWFGGQDPVDPKNFFAQFAVDPDYLAIYRDDVEISQASPPQGPAVVPEGVDPRLAAYLDERTACLVGHRLLNRMGWRLGQTVTLKGTIYPGNWAFTIRAVYDSKRKGFSDDAMLFHWDYLNERGLHDASLVGVFVLKLTDPSRAAQVVQQVDAQFENSTAATHTESERAFQAGFVSMYGNLPFVLKVIGFAVVFSILLVAANTMMIAIRERVTEIGVMKTLGFDDRTVFLVVLAEGAVITLGGGLLGALLARLLVEGLDLRVLPPMRIGGGTIALGIAVATLIGAVSSVLPAWQAARLRIIEALRRT